MVQYELYLVCKRESSVRMLGPVKRILPGFVKNELKAVRGRKLPRSLEIRLNAGLNSLVVYREKLLSVDKTVFRTSLHDLGVRAGGKKAS